MAQKRGEPGFRRVKGAQPRKARQRRAHPKGEKSAPEKIKQASAAIASQINARPKRKNHSKTKPKTVSRLQAANANANVFMRRDKAKPAGGRSVTLSK